MENDADRLASIKGLGGQLVSTGTGSPFWAIFDAIGSQSQFDDTHVNSTSPQLTLRTSDVKLFNLEARATAIVVDGITYLVREHLAGDAPGWSVLVLNEQ